MQLTLWVMDVWTHLCWDIGLCWPSTSAAKIIHRDLKTSISARNGIKIVKSQPKRLKNLPEQFNVLSLILVLCTRNALDCDQSNYSSRIFFSHIPIAFVQTGISAIRFADPENPILEQNTA